MTESFSCVCPVIDNKFGLNIVVKVVCGSQLDQIFLINFCLVQFDSLYTTFTLSSSSRSYSKTRAVSNLTFLADVAWTAHRSMKLVAGIVMNFILRWQSEIKDAIAERQNISRPSLKRTVGEPLLIRWNPTLNIKWDLKWDHTSWGKSNFKIRLNQY